MSLLFEPLQVGSLKLPNRILMAPLSRGRATQEHIPTPLMTEYYRQRSRAGLILSEATGISREGLGWPYAPGIWNTEQVAAWHLVTEAVHQSGGRILCQLWHMGRLVHPDYLGGAAPVSASATTAPDQAYTYEGKKDYQQARPLNLEEIPRLLDDYRQATRNALEAGFDGVQIHAANGYLIDQFLRDGTNHRTDQYGGTPDNRIRLLLEITQAVKEVIGKAALGVRLSPNEPIQGCDDSDPASFFPLVADALNDTGVDFLEVREGPQNSSFFGSTHPPIAPKMRQAFRGLFFLNSDQTFASATLALSRKDADAVTFGRPYIANPDLPYRFLHRVALNVDDRNTWYGSGSPDANSKGYTDYPTAPLQSVASVAGKL